MSETRIKLAPDTVAYADEETRKLVVEFSIPAVPTDTIDVKILGDSIHLDGASKGHRVRRGTGFSLAGET